MKVLLLILLNFVIYEALAFEIATIKGGEICGSHAFCWSFNYDSMKCKGLGDGRVVCSKGEDVEIDYHLPLAIGSSISDLKIFDKDDELIFYREIAGNNSIQSQLIKTNLKNKKLVWLLQSPEKTGPKYSDKDFEYSGKKYSYLGKEL